MNRQAESAPLGGAAEPEVPPVAPAATNAIFARNGRSHPGTAENEPRAPGGGTAIELFGVAQRRWERSSVSFV